MIYGQHIQNINNLLEIDKQTCAPEQKVSLRWLQANPTPDGIGVELKRLSDDDGDSDVDKGKVGGLLWEEQIKSSAKNGEKKKTEKENEIYLSMR